MSSYYDINKYVLEQFSQGNIKKETAIHIIQDLQNKNTSVEKTEYEMDVAITGMAILIAEASS
jgi:hypothetical protein